MSSLLSPLRRHPGNFDFNICLTGTNVSLERSEGRRRERSERGKERMREGMVGKARTP
jgi:hypothetical protein